MSDKTESQRENVRAVLENFCVYDSLPACDFGMIEDQLLSLQRSPTEPTEREGEALAVLRELHQYALVIESALRASGEDTTPEQYEAVLDAFKRVRKILNSLPTKTPDRNQRAQILDVLDHAHEYTSSETEWLAKSIRAILSSEEEGDE